MVADLQEQSAPVSLHTNRHPACASGGLPRLLPLVSSACLGAIHSSDSAVCFRRVILHSFALSISFARTTALSPLYHGSSYCSLSRCYCLHRLPLVRPLAHCAPTSMLTSCSSWFARLI